MNEHDNNCTALSHRVAELERRLDRSEKDHKEFFDRLRAIEKNEAVQHEKFDALMKKLDGISESVESLTSAPGKKWEAMMDKIFFAVVGAVVAFLLSKVGL